MNFLLEVIIQGLAYSLLAMGIALTYKILNVADLTVDGSFPLGAVVGAMCLTYNLPVLVALGLALLAGGAAGMMTGWLTVKLKIQPLLSGILTMSGLYTINLLVGGDRANIPVFQAKTIFTVPTWLPQSLVALYPLFVLIIIVGLVKVALDWFLKTKRGYMLRVAGDNPRLVVALGEDLGKYTYIGLALSNAIIALGGGVVMMLSRYYALSMGAGMIVVGLASVVLGDTLLKRTGAAFTTMAIAGSLLYRLSIAGALALNLHPSALKLLTVIIFVLAIVVNRMNLSSIYKKLGGHEHAHTKPYQKVVSPKYNK